jgi:iron(III) transport system permease protein
VRGRVARALAGYGAADWLVIGAAVAATAWLVAVPLAFLLGQSFATPEAAGRPAAFTLANYAAAYGAASRDVIVNSLVYAGGSSALALAVGTALAWINERTNAPGKSLLFAASLLPLIVPSALFVVSWTVIASPRVGLVNALWRRLGGDLPLVDIYSLAGMIWVDGLHDAPVAFLMMSAAFRAMDPALEEAALASGASIRQVLRRVTLPLAAPALLALAALLFVRALESFEAPALLGLPAGIPVLTAAIYDAIHRYPSDVGLAAAYATVLLVVTGTGVALQARLGRHADRYATVAGQDGKLRRVDLGRWRVAAAALFALYLLLAVALPFAALLWTSLAKAYAAPSLGALDRLSLDAYAAVMRHPGVARAALNSVLLAIGSATAVMLLTAVVSWIVLKARVPGRWLLEGLASVPVAVPGIVLGLALLIASLALGGALYGTIWILLVAYVTRFLPYGMRANGAAMLQIGRELEEEAALGGASWRQTFRLVVIPLLRPGLIAG